MRRTSSSGRSARKVRNEGDCVAADRSREREACISEDSKPAARYEPSLVELKQSGHNCKSAEIGIDNCRTSGRRPSATKCRGHNNATFDVDRSFARTSQRLRFKPG